MSVRLRPGVLIDGALLSCHSPIANAATAETIIPEVAPGVDVNVRYVRTAIYVRLSHDISVLYTVGNMPV